MRCPPRAHAELKAFANLTTDAAGTATTGLAVDDYTVNIYGQEPDAEADSQLPTTVYPMEHIEEYPDRGADPRNDLTPIGTGPFEFESYEAEQRAQFTTFEDYWLDVLGLDALEWWDGPDGFPTSPVVDEVTVSELDPETETETPAPGQSVSLQDITVSGASGEIENTPATIRFRISSERLEERGTTAENLRAFRLNNGDWQRLETSVAAETDTGGVLEADTPGFSVFAVSAVTPPEGSIALDPGTATVNEAVELSGAESTDPDGEIVSYEWSVDGETLTGETVTVALEEPGEYTVELVVTDDAGETDTVTGTLVAEAADTATPGSDTSEPDVESPTGPVEEPGGFDTLPVVVVAIVLLLGAGYAVYRQRER